MTNKEIQEHLRILAQQPALSANQRIVLDHYADELDPPGSDIPDGFVWFRYLKDGEWTRYLKDDEWTRGVLVNGVITDELGYKHSVGAGIDILPARILEPGQVAVDREVVEYMAKDAYAPIFIKSQFQAALDRDKEDER